MNDSKLFMFALKQLLNEMKTSGSKEMKGRVVYGDKKYQVSITEV